MGNSSISLRPSVNKTILDYKNNNNLFKSDYINKNYDYIYTTSILNKLDSEYNHNYIECTNLISFEV